MYESINRVVLRLLCSCIDPHARRPPCQLSDTELHSFTSHAIRTVLFFLFLGYPTLSASMLRVFNCIEIHGEYFVKHDVSIPCYDATHSGYQMLASLGVLLYPIGIPLLFYGLLIRYRVHELARHRQQAAVLQQVVLQQVYHENSSGKQLPEVIAWVSKHGSNGEQIYAEMPTVLLERLLHFTEEKTDAHTNLVESCGEVRQTDV